MQIGFTSVMMDGSLLEDQKTPADYEYNVAVTRRVVEMAHACGVSVEGELGCLGSLETGTAGEEDGVGAEGVLNMDQLLTDPESSGFCCENRGGCIGNRHWHLARSIQVQPTTLWRYSGHRPY